MKYKVLKPFSGVHFGNREAGDVIDTTEQLGAQMQAYGLVEPIEVAQKLETKPEPTERKAKK